MLWVKKEKLMRLRRGLYALPPQMSAQPLSGEAAASLLYFPSYLSLESALSHYELIPERVAEWTSITTRKTMRFVNSLGRFSYCHVTPKRFFGFDRLEGQGSITYLARPEKALLDWIYLDDRKVADPGDYIDILRLQNTESLSRKKLMETAGRFESKKIAVAAAALSRALKMTS
ncbi:MAG: hypothetical protein HYT79_00760 [Elusimicrobia bacterium]|nr:hypothetical protein [Elusimicrobiota bacterium]